MTKYTCLGCQQEFINGNTAVHVFCGDCAQKGEQCMQCGCDIELRVKEESDEPPPQV